MRRRGSGGEVRVEDTPPETETTTCFLRLNRHPPASAGHGVLGLCGHTDTDFLTILRQDYRVGGLLLLLRGGRWRTVKPSPGALIVRQRRQPTPGLDRLSDLGRLGRLVEEDE
ncbi:hypothetical protein BRADI_1g38112v3 [Brachypodium distachyon]|uniref:Isopenicillin N synthase-like Fe(2+) 2OG dioxygenase domain-containing protein n=1 Tax=Brachypodium distachyon TaxID=15368 RepID=A0A0Q3RZI9_BRADI|nr:hypothetical protein BRADI_1g38112v3 [Brachypodium distachyon]